MPRSPPSTACAPCRMAKAISSRVSRAALRAARAGSALSAGGKIAAGEPVLPRSRAARRRRSRGAAGGSRPAKTPASSTITTSPAAAAASRSMCRNITRPTARWPLVMALHGGSGNGRGFLWSWLRDARSLGAILVAPTATGPTWALMGDDTDTPNLMRILEAVRARWNVDPRADAADRHERRRHLLLCQRARRRLALHPSRAGRRPPSIR